MEKVQSHEKDKIILDYFVNKYKEALDETSKWDSNSSNKAKLRRVRLQLEDFMKEMEK